MNGVLRNPVLRRRREGLPGSGFTLLELLIVLVLVALILGLSSLFVAGRLPSARANAAGREISGMLRHARSLARLNMETRRFVIDLDSRTYGIEGLAKKSFPPEARVRIVDPLAGEIVAGQYPIVFTPVGGAAGGTIILSWGKKVIRIELDPLVGAVVLKDG